MADHVFVASPEGFRAQNLSRPPEHLVRELIQNVFDENAGECRVELKHTPVKGLYLSVQDDIPGGIRDERLVFTIWESDKQDSPTKRGRMGLGLKELVSVSDKTVISTQGRPATVFERRQGEWSRKTTSTIAPPPQGTRVEVWVQSWTRKDMRAIMDYLHRVRPPIGTWLYVCGTRVQPVSVEEYLHLELPTVQYLANSDGERRVSHHQRETLVSLFKEPNNGGSWVYEMGLPVDKINFPFSVDVAQRVPLRERRDTLMSWFRADLITRLISARKDRISDEDCKSAYIMEAISSTAPSSFHADVREKIVKAWTGGLPYASTAAEFREATGQHVQVVKLGDLPESIREIVRLSGKPVKAVLQERHAELCPTVSFDDCDANEKRLVKVWDFLAEKIGRPCYVKIADGRPDAEASFSRGGTGALGTLTLYRKVLGESFFQNPLSARALSVLIHELAHWEPHEHAHGQAFHADGEEVGGVLAAYLFENASMVAAMV